MADDDGAAPAADSQPAPAGNQGSNAGPEPEHAPGQQAQADAKAKDDKAKDDQAKDKDKDAKDDDAGKPEEDKEAEKQEALRAQKFRDALSDPLGDSDSGQAVHAVRTTGARKVRTQQYGEFRDSDIRNLYIGSSFLTASRPSLVDGPVSADELRRLREVFVEPAGYRSLLADLRKHRLLVLSGEPGSGRTSLGLSLLDAAAEGIVHRLDPGTDLSNLAEDELGEARGYILEPPADGSGPEITAMYLDRYAAQLTERDAFAVLIVDGFGRSEVLALSRFGRQHGMPSADGVLAGQLRSALPEADDRTRAELLAVATHPRTAEALGLRGLRPGEARALADLIAARHRGELDEERFLGECRTFVPAQVQEWFAEFTGACDPRSDAAERALAFRIALAVYDGASYDLVVEAAERLVHRLVATSRPTRPHGRPLFTGEPAARISAARAEVGTGTEDLGRSSVPVRTVEFAGDRFPSAVLLHLWDRCHTLRGPVLGWLLDLGQEARTTTWMRAAVAAGLLASLDFPSAYYELILPMATAEQSRSRWFAATVLDHAATDDRVRPAVAALVKQWGRSGGPALRRTAAFVHSYGRVAGSVEASMRQLRRIGTADDGAYDVVAYLSVVELLGRSGPEVVLDHVARWVGDERRVVVDLGLLTVVRMVHTRTADVWDSDEAPWLAGHGDWPLPLALVTARPELTEEIADVIWAGLRNSRSSALIADGIADWLRGAQEHPERLPVLIGLLRRLIDDESDYRRLRHLVAALRRDPDEPLDDGVARRVSKALKMEAPR